MISVYESSLAPDHLLAFQTHKPIRRVVRTLQRLTTLKIKLEEFVRTGFLSLCHSSTQDIGPCMSYSARALISVRQELLIILSQFTIYSTIHILKIEKSRKGVVWWRTNLPPSVALLSIVKFANTYPLPFKKHRFSWKLKFIQRSKCRCCRTFISKILPLRSKKAGRFEKLHDFACFA